MGRLEIRLCEWCGCEIRRGSRGPVRRYCNAACRMAASRARKASAAVQEELRRDGAAFEPVVHAHRAPSACSDEQVARAFLEAKTLAGVFASLGVDARPALAWRCTHIAQALHRAIIETLGED